MALGPRALGYVDPGALSMVLILEAMATSDWGLVTGDCGP